MQLSGLGTKYTVPCIGLETTFLPLYVFVTTSEQCSITIAGVLEVCTRKFHNGAAVVRIQNDVHWFVNVGEDV